MRTLGDVMIDAMLVKKLAFEAGFDLCGTTSPQVIPEARERYYRWIDSGYHGEMAYLAKNRSRRSDPTLLLAGTRSVIMLGLNYYQPKAPDTQKGMDACHDTLGAKITTR